MPQSLSDPRQVIHTHLPLFIMHCELVPANGSDVLKLTVRLAETTGSLLLGL